MPTAPPTTFAGLGNRRKDDTATARDQASDDNSDSWIRNFGKADMIRRDSPDRTKEAKPAIREAVFRFFRLSFFRGGEWAMVENGARSEGEYDCSHRIATPRPRRRTSSSRRRRRPPSRRSRARPISPRPPRRPRAVRRRASPPTNRDIASVA